MKILQLVQSSIVTEAQWSSTNKSQSCMGGWITQQEPIVVSPTEAVSAVHTLNHHWVLCSSNCFHGMQHACACGHVPYYGDYMHVTSFQNSGLSQASDLSCTV